MICFLDFTTPESIFDCKYNKSADPAKFEREIHNLGYAFQAGTYVRAAMAVKLYEDLPDYHFLVYDKTGNYSIIKLDYSYINYGMRQLDYYLEAVDRCIKENAWNKSYDFFNRVHTVTKPRWAKAFPLSTDTDDEI
ncbi:hypothetical protein Phi46:1_gp30 [Cellulophaga phage phi46:1]|uniref:hypothetical protein n=1 Tax=Cellulophaga phage phi46:1 TaxID=1327974 RepID=UPI0003518A13|nr:hypothetical protein Phi46:1_gp30 [Cellulophaga phage phi46:1]AGO47841.1 hypothetical protein Phi46:1_gp30 [Cellulophaga phage phi46:1]